MVEGCLGALLILFLLPVIRAFVCVYRLVNPDARGRRGAARELLGCLGWFAACALLIALILPRFPAARESARRWQCTNNLKQIVLGMHNYSEEYGCFPPAYTEDSRGRPLHDWRVLLLPFVEQEPFYRKLRLDESWDDPHNLSLFAQAGSRENREGWGSTHAFRCPSDPEPGPLTNFVMIVGPRTISNGPNSVRPKEIADGASNTIAVVETYGLGIRWYEPRDLRVDEMSFEINDSKHFGVASRHPGGANVGFADGSVRFLSDSTDPQVVEAATTFNGGENVPLP